MSVVRSMEEVGPCRQKLEIEVPKPAVDAETSRVVEEYRRKVNLPGFRKGKAPRELVARRFGDKIRQDVIDRLVPRYWHQAEAEKQLDPLMPPALEGVEFELGETMSFTAVVETRPAIALGDLEGFDLPAPATGPTQDEVERQLADIQRRFGTWKPVERSAARGDRVQVKVHGEGQDEPDSLSFEVGEDQVWEELSLAVTGLAAGQQSTFRRAPRPDSEPREYRVEVAAVEEIELPDVDDELAGKVGVETADELRSRVEQSLAGAKQREARRQREQAMLAQLRDRHPIPLPAGVVDHELEGMVREWAENLAHQGVDLEKAEIDWGGIAERLRPEAERAVHTRLVLDAVAAERGIEVPEEKLEELLAEIARSRGTSSLAVRRELDGSGRLATLRRQLQRQRTVSALLGDPEPGAGEPEGEAGGE